MHSHSSGKLYRAREGLVFGVCQGIANWRELPVGIIRILALVLIIMSGGGPGILVYLFLGLFLPVEPRGSGYDNPKSDDGPKNYREKKADKEQDWDQRFYGRK